MKTTSRSTYALLVTTFVVSLAASQAHAWNPPPGPAIDRATEPKPTPTTLLREAHGYIIQNGISILYNDGYWFSAEMLRQWQQELLNGVRYADAYDGRQEAVLDLCFVFGLKCTAIYSRSWPLAANTHYFNPDTGRGLDLGALNKAAFWAEFLPQSVLEYLTLGLAYLDIDIRPNLKDSYPSALQMFDEEYANALHAYFDRPAPKKAHPRHAALDRSHPAYNVGGRQGTALAMFYLGWASHLMQDQTVVHHTYNEAGKHHAEYEDASNGLGEIFAPIADGHKRGKYEDELPVVNCFPGSRRCFASYAAHVSHDANILDRIDQGDYTHVQFAIPFAQNLQAGLYAAFLTDIGLPPVHMSAIMAAL